MRPYDDTQDEAVMGWVKLTVGLALAFGIFMLGVIFAPPASSHSLNCTPRSDLVEALKERYKEKPLWLGLRSAEAEGVPIQLYVEIWVGKDTWTLTIGSQGDDQMCVIMPGQEWVLNPEVTPPAGREAAEEESP